LVNDRQAAVEPARWLLDQTGHPVGEVIGTVGAR
jgi:hypothetical protein